MKYKYLDSEEIYDDVENKKILNILYNKWWGRTILKVITNPVFSKLVGRLLDCKISCIYIKEFIKNNSIDLNKYKEKKYSSFNDFFVRELKAIDKDSKSNEYISTAESKLSFYKISKDLIIDVKNTKYSIEELIQDKKIAKEYSDGICLVFRLSPSNFHRYIFCDDGRIKMHKKIKGKLHTVNPIVYDKYKVFIENSREVSILNTKNFGKIVQIEVGALCVGRIKNNNIEQFKKYEEKGFFEYGGSTIIQLIKKDTVKIEQEIIDNTFNNIETFVNVGQVIGEIINY